MRSYVKPTRDGAAQIMSMETGIPLMEIDSETLLGEKRERILEICQLRFNRTIVGTPDMKFRDFLRLLGVR